jgi:hypothetical protein
MKITTILDQIDLGAMALPEFQRGYVWNRDQVRRLMGSLYRRYPVGSLLVWVTKTETAPRRGDGEAAGASVELILDGQQRMTSLYGVIRGKPPEFFDGRDSFSGLHFNLEDETFSFYMPSKMEGNPRWISVTELMQVGAGKFLGRIYRTPGLEERADVYADRLNRLDGIKAIDLHVEKVTGDEITLDDVVDIFNEVNSGGTKLSKGDLALAKICASWPEARDEMKRRIGKWKQAGFSVKLELLLRVVNAILTGEAKFEALEGVRPAEFRNGLERAEKRIDTLFNLIGSRLGLDHDRVLGSIYSFPLMARYLDERDGHLEDFRERDRLLFWYIHTLLWGRYAGSTESKLNQDLAAVEQRDGALDRLIQNLRRERGELKLLSGDFEGWGRGARFYPFLYMMTRVWNARDWGSGLELSQHLLGKLNRLQVHHIFPKALLYQHGYDKTEVNAIANFTFLTQETNLQVSDRDPSEYLPVYEQKHPGAVESHWIPADPDLWRPENYLRFLAARRQLLADSANSFLDTLYQGDVSEPGGLKEVHFAVSPSEPGMPAGAVATEDEERVLLETNTWIVEQGLPEGEFMYEIIDDESERVLAVLDLAWPAGLQAGFSRPVALLLDEPDETFEAANRAGFRFFVSPEDLKKYVEEEILLLAGT